MTSDLTAKPHTRLLASQTGAHLPYLDLLPASETVRYAQAAIAMIVSVLSAFAGWALVGYWASAGLSTTARVALALGAGAAFGLIVWSVDRELISGDGHLSIRAVIAAINALFVGEIVLLALFAPFVNTEIDRYRQDTHSATVAQAQSAYDQTISTIDQDQIAAVPAEPPALLDARQQRHTALDTVVAAEAELATLVQIRSAEVTGRVIIDDDGQPLTSGRAGDQGAATDSIDRQIATAQQQLDRANAELGKADQRLDAAEASYADQINAANGQEARYETDRAAAQQTRDFTIAAAQQAKDAPVGLLRRIHVFHQAAWTETVLAVSVLSVHLAILAAEMSVVLWALNERRRPTRLYPTLVTEIDDQSNKQLSDLAQHIINPTPSNDAPSFQPAPTAPRAQNATEPQNNTTAATPKRVSQSHNATKEQNRRTPIRVQLLATHPKFDGLTKPLKPKQLAVLAYLAVHRTAPTAKIRATFWPDSCSTSAADNAISAVRRALGDDPNGNPLLTSQDAQGNIALSDHVSTDWADFVATVTNPTKQTLNSNACQYRDALGLLQGSPCSAASGAEANWSWLSEHLTEQSELAVAVRTAADRVILSDRNDSETETVSWALERARFVIPGYERPPQLAEADTSTLG